MGTKTCTKCNIEKDFDCFHKEKKGKFGLKSRCKDCHMEYKRNNPMENEYNRRNYLKYQEEKKAYSRKYKEENAEQVKQYNLEYNARPIVKLSKRIKNIEIKQYEIKPSFMLDQPNGPLNHDLPVMHKTPNVNDILNAHLDNNLPYNKNQYPAFDPYNQNIGVMTIHDLDGSNPNTKLPLEYTT